VLCASTASTKQWHIGEQSSVTLGKNPDYRNFNDNKQLETGEKLNSTLASVDNG
jgi:hypothetical protein